MRCSRIKWNPNGSVLAIAGTQVANVGSESKELSMIQFYTPFGHHLKSLKVPGSGVQALSWEGSGLRISVSLENRIK